MEPSSRTAGIAMFFVAACRQDPPATVTDTGVDVPTASMAVEVEVDGEIVFAGMADRPAYGLYQPPREDADCLASRRVGVFQGASVFVELVFPGEFPEVGAQVQFPAQLDSAATDWTAATWVDADDQAWAAYGGLATLEAYTVDLVEVSLVQATVCRSDRVGRLDPLVDGTWDLHTSDCAESDQIVFRTAERLPFELDREPWCALGRAQSWLTRDGEAMCSELTEPCEVDVDVD